jgi:hypothetical protein
VKRVCEVVLVWEDGDWSVHCSCNLTPSWLVGAFRNTGAMCGPCHPILLQPAPPHPPHPPLTRCVWCPTRQVETGNPFMLYKDSANRKSNQQNLGTIKSSNLCTGAPRLHGFMPSSPPQFPCQSHRSHNGGLWSFSLAVACRHGAACCFVSAFNRTRPLAPRSPLAL